MKQYIVDAFTDEVFHGNQAAICILDQWLPEDLMINITRENNFSETAFAVKEGNKYHLRWLHQAAKLTFAAMLPLPALTFYSGFIFLMQIKLSFQPSAVI